MHLCWELQLLCAGQSTELLLCGLEGSRGGLVVQKSRDDLVRVIGTRWELKARCCGSIHELQR